MSLALRGRAFDDLKSGRHDKEYLNLYLFTVAPGSILTIVVWHDEDMRFCDIIATGNSGLSKFKKPLFNNLHR